MKRIVSIIITLCLINNISVFAYENITSILETSDFSDMMFNEVQNGETCISVLNGKTYVVSKCRSFVFEPVEFDEEAESHFKNEMYVKAGENYYTRELENDFPYIPATRKYNINPQIRLYDKDFNLLKEGNLKETVFPKDIWYENNEYYCSYYEDYKYVDGELIPATKSDIYNGQTHAKYLITVKSEDFEDWNVIDKIETSKLHITYKDKLISNNKVNLKDNMIDIFKNYEFCAIAYEESADVKYITKAGDWFICVDSNGNLLFTNDKVYYVNILLEDSIKELPTHLLNESTEISYVYTDNGKIKIQLGNYNNLLSKIVISESELCEILNKVANSPYIKLNDKILGFSQPPVMEDDRTLVPMRFLFEQMGADVNWNEATQTATATLSSARGGDEALGNSAVKGFVDSAAAVGLAEQGTAFKSKAKPLVANTGGETNSVTFSIDDTNAIVNGEDAMMDVPARLINDQTFVPLRFLSENLGYDVQWDESTNTAIITTE